jgi:hypothetical protein
VEIRYESIDKILFGSSIDPSHFQFDESKANLYGSCTQPCAGDPSEMCGNAATLSVYKYNPNKSSGSTTSSRGRGGGRAGGAGAAGSAMYVGVPMTPSACTDHCTQGGFAIAGTEYAGKRPLSLPSPSLLRLLTPPPRLTHLPLATVTRY